jgi:flagellar biosynthetic protein FliR
MMTMESEALVFARTIGFVFKAPGFSNKAIPALVRATFASIFTLLVAPSVPSTAAHSAITATFAFLVVGEFAVGATIGMAAAILYNGIDSGGNALDDFVGIKGSNPTAGPMAGVGFGVVWSYVFTNAFFMLGGYLLPLQVFADGLREIPPGSLFEIHQWKAFLFAFPTLTLRAGLMIAGPAYVIGLVAQFAMGGISRIIPKFNTQNISFGITFAVVLLMTIIMLPNVAYLAAHPWIPYPLPGVAPAKTH